LQAHLARWRASSLAFQFLFVGGIVSLIATLVVGAVVAVLIERAATRNAAATTALYVDSVIAPILPNMQTTAVLDDVVTRALDETLGKGALGRRLAEMRLWRPDGTILYSNDKALVGRRFPVTPSLQQAFQGRIVARYDHYDALNGGAEQRTGPLLEIYNPILQPWSGDVVAVLEFYERADDFAATLVSARLRTWLAVAGVIAVIFLALSAIVMRGSRTIDRQAKDLNLRVAELSHLLEQNRNLHLKVRRATQRAASLNESYLRRLGADLHDGPAQFIAAASLRLDSNLLLDATAPKEAREREIASIHGCLHDALQEIRSICQGLVLPQIEGARLTDVVSTAITAYERRTGTLVERRIADIAVESPLSQRICVYRFLQEALNNGHRHCRGAKQSVELEVRAGKLTLTVSDKGPGFDPSKVPADRLGIAGMRERIESLGGSFRLETSSQGTKLLMMLDVEETIGK
jgi:signal transduction histidine kinase